MAHVVNELRPPTFSTSGDKDTASRTFQVVLDSDQVGAATAVQAVADSEGLFAGAPYIYRNEVRAGVRCEKIGPAKAIYGKNKLTHYEVPVSYSSTQQPEGEQPENPLDLAWKWDDSGTRTISDTTNTDADDKPILNAAGDPIHHDVQVDDYVSWIKGHKNVVSVNFSWLAEFTGKWNESEFMGRDEKTVRVSSMSYSALKHQRDVTYRELQIEFEFWRSSEQAMLEVPNVGWRANFFEIAEDAVQVRKAAIMEGALAPDALTSELSVNIGAPVSSPVMLQKDGFIANPQEREQREHNTILVDIQETADFNSLPVH